MWLLGQGKYGIIIYRFLDIVKSFKQQVPFLWQWVVGTNVHTELRVVLGTVERKEDLFSLLCANDTFLRPA